MKNLKKQLKKIKKESLNKMKRWIIDDILDSGANDEEIEAYIKDVLMLGCQSGIVTSLMYYDDTYKFFSKFSFEIMELVDELFRQGITVENYHFNYLSWLAYEETVRKIAEKLNLEV